ncbi:hypothetical protein ACG9XL_18790, partial [Acinetobacter nosocomialis]|uniref:hypothetical protein n=1 Tax=Acinetobacter nosocomialis TaxID=106654 RepID=UPI003AF86035
LEHNYLASNTNGCPCFHLFNNILDMYSNGMFSLSALVQKIKMLVNDNFIFAVSPNFYLGNKGFDALHNLIQPRTIYLNDIGTIEIKEYRYTLQKIFIRKAPVRAYSVKL